MQIEEEAEMSIVSAFGDDDHTAADGPYSRVMKVRKWLYIFGACAFLLSFGLYDGPALKNLVRVVSLPSWLLIQVIASGVAYLLLQYLLLCGQLWRTYDIVLGERLAYRRADELARAANQAAEARSALEKNRNSQIESARVRVASANDRMIEANRELEHLHDRSFRMTAESSSSIQDYDRSFSKQMMASEIHNAEIRATAAERDLQIASDYYSRVLGATEWVPDDNDSVELFRARERAEREFEKLRRQDPANRRGYRDLEKAVDIMRIVPPAVFALLSLISLVRLAL